jgi:AcrR family transcriptional regulator
MTSPVRRGRGQPSRRRGLALTERITEAARELFLAEGFEASMDSVAAAAQTTKATVYKHFGNKQALFIEVISRELDRALEEPQRLVESRLARSTHVREDLVDVCRVLVAGVAASTTIALRNLIAGELRRFPELGAAWGERGPGRFYPILAGALHRLVEDRQLSIKDVDLAVHQLIGLVLAPNLVFGGFGVPLDNETTERLIRLGVDMFVNQYEHRENA